MSLGDLGRGIDTGVGKKKKHTLGSTYFLDVLFKILRMMCKFNAKDVLCPEFWREGCLTDLLYIERRLGAKLPRSIE